MEDDVIPSESENDDENYEMTPEQATSLESSAGSPGVFNRKKVLIFLCIALAVTVMGALIFNSVKSSKKASASGADEYAQTRSNSTFLTSLRDSGLRNASLQNSDIPQFGVDENEIPEALLPPVSFERQIDDPVYAPPPVNQPAPQQQQYQGTPPQGSSQPGDSHLRSPLVPQIQGSLFSGQNNSGNGQYASAASNAAPYDDYLNSLYERAASYNGQTQGYQGENGLNNSQNFYESTNNSGAVYTGQYLGENALWTGTMIPGVLETSINTDLPGQVLARVTQNIYDSQTGRSLLIPQGTLLIARYNSSVSYAQSRVQIIWDTLIRPDGFQLELEGANGVDRAGMSGQDAVSNGNFFEYVKAAGIITLFSIANAKLTETVQKYNSGDDAAAAGIAESNARFFNQLGGELASQAMNVSPTLTVDNGAVINIMLNKTLYLPPVSNVPVTQKYILE